MQVALPSAVVILLICGLLTFTLTQLAEIRRQNHALLSWTWAIEHTQDAIYSTNKARGILEKLVKEDGDRDDLLFDLAEHQRNILEHARHEDVLTLLKPDTQTFIETRVEALRNDETIQPKAVLAIANELLPKLEAVHKFFNVEKWNAYVKYYESVNTTTSRLIVVSLFVLLVAVIASIMLTAWAIVRIKSRLRSIVEDTEKIVDGDRAILESGRSPQDPLEKLTAYIDRITDRLAHAGRPDKLLTIVENERKRIAMDMHDEVLSDLTALSREVAELKHRPFLSDVERHAQLEAFEAQLDDLSNGNRSVIDDLHPYALDALGLEAAIRSFVDKHLRLEDKERFTLHFANDLDAYLDDAQRLNLYRVALEALCNTVRHANATRCEVTAHVVDRDLMLIVEDNGDGFDPETAMASNTYGLWNIEERAKALGGRVQWLASRFSKGTRFEFRMPVGLSIPEAVS